MKKLSSQYSYFIFDLDGTILDSKGDIKHCLELTFSDFGLPFNEELLVVGPPMENILKILLPDAEEILYTQIAKKYRAYYNCSDLKYTVLYPNVLDFIKHLFKEDKKLFIATNKPRSSTEKVLDKFGLSHYFTAILTPDFSPPMSKKEMVKYIIDEYNLNPTETIMLGDTASDVEAGQTGGIDTAVHLSGYSGKDDLSKVGASFLFENYFITE